MICPLVLYTTDRMLIDARVEPGGVGDGLCVVCGGEREMGNNNE